MTFVKVLNGLILILIGVIFLLINFDRLGWAIWAPLVRLWPVVLILIGLDLLGQNRPLRFLKVLVPIALLAVIGYLFLSYVGPEEVAVSYFEHPVSGVNELTARLTIDDAHCEVHPDYSGNLLSGRLRYPVDSEEPETLFEVEEAEAVWTLIFQQADESIRAERDREVSIGIAEGVPLRLQLDCTASSCELDLRDLDTRFVRITADVSSVDVDLGEDSSESALVLNGSLAQFDISVARATGIHLESKGSLRITNLPEDLEETEDGIYETADFDIAPTRVLIYLDSDLSRLRISRR
jgi:hypothetical protein